MARDHARIVCAIWRDDTFIALSKDAQRQWFLLLASSGRIDPLDADGLDELASAGWVTPDGTFVSFARHEHIAKFPRRRGRRPIAGTLRSAVYERDGWKCATCGSADDLTVDHLLPFSRGGADDYENFQTLCRPCNSRKGAKV